ncbi:hypothetical protein [Streptomyces sp. ML-6]|uniref:hypothetical protein n=1 Tax=Streptomyces sp. ML-6 TaxID=2982693 RepID=UPI0024C06443|nr:hypothetical protein [Streptomyces sp. ML-6]MDK0520396.1 hypothetical protein [Streptomyces sp. ML-6]
MAQDSWPSPAHNSRAVTDAEYEQLAAAFSGDGVYGSPADAAVVTAGTGLTVTVRAGVYASLRGHAWSSGTTADTLTIAANSSGSTRADAVVLRLDRADWTVRAVVKQGTGATAPAPTQSAGPTGVWEIPLATVTVANGAGTVTVSRAELYVGARVRPSLSTRLNPRPARGEMAYETDTGRVRVWDGAAWRSLYDRADPVTVDSALSAWTLGTQAVIEAHSGNVHMRLGSCTRAAGNLAAGGESRLPMLVPAAYRHPTRDQYGIVYITGSQIGRVTIYSKASDRPGQVWLSQHPGVSTGQNVLGSTVSWVVS